MFRLKHAFWGVIATVLTGLGLLQWMHQTHLVMHLDKDALANTTNYMIYDLTYRQFDAQGHLTHFLKTPYVEHIPQNNTHIITSPNIRIVEPNQPPWEIQSGQAVARNGSHEITFSQHVRILQHHPDNETLLRTEHLTYFPDNKHATSEDEVTLSQGENILQSKGMIADLSLNHVQLLSNARGQYAPSAG